jgi:hypothetical protein
MAARRDPAAEAFAAGGGGGGIEQDDPEAARALGERAALLVAAGQVWEREIGPLLSASEVQHLLGDVSRQRVGELIKSDRLLALRDRSRNNRFPAWQFGDDGRPYDAIAFAIRHLRPVTASPFTIASWFTSPADLLDGELPARWLRTHDDHGPLIEAARRDAAALGQP